MSVASLQAIIVSEYDQEIPQSQTAMLGWWGPDALAVCRAHRGLPVGFLLLRYSVLFTVESLYLLYLLVLYVLGDDALIS